MQQTEKITERTTVQDNASAKGVSSQQYMHTEQAAAFVPLLQSLITGVMIGLAVFGLLSLYRVRDAWLYGLVTWFTVQAITWIALSTHWFVLTMAALEMLTKKDINGDGVIGMPGRGPKTAEPWGVKVTMREVRENGHLGQTTFIELLGSPTAIVMFATALLGGSSIAERLWSGDGKPFSQDDFRENRKTLLKHLLIELKNPKDERQGYQLTPKGTQTMRDVRDQYAGRVSPPPPGEDA